MKGTIPCKGFGECVLPKWFGDGKADCLDGSDEGDSIMKFPCVVPMHTNLICSQLLVIAICNESLFDTVNAFI